MALSYINKSPPFPFLLFLEKKSLLQELALFKHSGPET